VAGLASVGQLSTAGRGANFFRGVASEKSSLSYFPAAFALKSTPSFIALTLVLFLVGGRMLTERRTLVLLVPAAILGFAAVTSHFNIGVRHILPIYPFLAIAGAGILANRSSPRLFAALALLLGFGSAVSLVRSHPFEMSYFNLLADRTGGGSRWLSDSNVDWGQDLMRLGHFLRERGWEDSTTVVAYGGLATNYFVRNARLLTPGEPIRPGRYAVGATIEAIGGPFVTNIEGPAAGAQVEELVRLLHAKGRPVARVGSITIWELPSPLSETLPSGPEPTGRSG
jgi:hypothetical protein